MDHHPKNSRESNATLIFSDEFRSKNAPKSLICSDTYSKWFLGHLFRLERPELFENRDSQAGGRTHGEESLHLTSCYLRGQDYEIANMKVGTPTKKEHLPEMPHEFLYMCLLFILAVF